MSASSHNHNGATNSSIAALDGVSPELPPAIGSKADVIPILEKIQNRILWLSTNMIHYANFVRANPDGGKVGGHQASSASLVSVMTALYFHALRAGDHIAVKPHASPVFHAIQYLLGRLPAEKLTQLRSFKGLQAYPSLTKDTGVDFSTGSVGLGAVAPNFAALTDQFVQDHFGQRFSGRQIALVGDAELDEGNIWEALGEENLRNLGNVLWIIDLNRQSLDRVVPSGKAQKIKEMFRINGWHVLELKYGHKLEAAFALPHGEKLRCRIDRMTNEEYQSLLRLGDGEKVRKILARGDGHEPDEELLQVLRPYSAEFVKGLLADLGGHDLKKILSCFAEADQVKDQPVVILAYTVKGWGLPLAGDPLNHSKLMNAEQMGALRQRLEIPGEDEFPKFVQGSAESNYIEAWVESLAKQAAGQGSEEISDDPYIPDSLDSTFRGEISTQQALGSLLNELARNPEVGARTVTTSPDVASSTNLGGWINKMGVYRHQQATDYFRENAIPLTLKWEQSPHGHHIELGISENNFFSMLNALGRAKELSGKTLLPIGTIYDPFICRGLDALIYAAYSKSKFIFAGTPSGISLSAEGGAHQSTICPGIGLQLPNLVCYEPAFAQELEWILLAGLRNLLDRKHGQIVYLRLSTRALNQDLFPRYALQDPSLSKALREDILRGGYRILNWQNEDGYEPGANVVNVIACGVMVANAMEAAHQLRTEGVFANVINATSPDLLYRGWRRASQIKIKEPNAKVSYHLEKLLPASARSVPIVTVADGHSHTLAFLGSICGTKTISLGVDEFGQSGTRGELYDHYGISTASIALACKSALG